jgi:RNA polymerase sigma-70 factor (ECF subfamily)
MQAWLTGGSTGVVEPPGDPDLEHCLESAITGDEIAFAVLYRDVQPRLQRYARVLVGQDADDVTAEAWLQISRDIRGFLGTMNMFRAWSARIVRNRALDHVRASSRRPVQLTDVESLLDAPTPDAEIMALDRMSTDHAVALIASLPREQAEAVMLRAVIGLDSAAAGEVLGKSPSSVRVAAHRGLKSLAKLVNVDDPAQPRRVRKSSPPHDAGIIR